MSNPRNCRHCSNMTCGDRETMRRFAERAGKLAGGAR